MVIPRILMDAACLLIWHFLKGLFGSWSLSTKFVVGSYGSWISHVVVLWDPLDLGSCIQTVLYCIVLHIVVGSNNVGFYRH